MPSKIEKDLLTIHVNVKITAPTLQAIVGHAKRLASQKAQGTFRVDTADYVAAMISRFLEEGDFESYVKDENNFLSLTETEIES